MNEEPFYNEPGYENNINKVKSDEYNEVVYCNKIIYAVRDMLDKSTEMVDELHYKTSCGYLKCY